MLRTMIRTSEYGLLTLVTEYAETVAGKTEEEKLCEFEIHHLTKSLPNSENLYNHINAYMNGYMTKEEQKIFFNAVKYSTEDGIDYSKNECVVALRDHLHKAIDAFNYDRFNVWFRDNTPDLPIPPDMSEVFIDESNVDMNDAESVKELEKVKTREKVREKTYIVSEYVDLMSLMVFLKAVRPIITQYHSYLHMNDNHPYYKLFCLFLDSGIDHKDNALKKLREYVYMNHSQIMQKNDYKTNLIYGAGLTEDDVVDYLASEALFNKAFSADQFDPKKPNEMKYIYNLISYNGKFKNSVKERVYARATKGGNKEEDYSIVEKHHRETPKITMGVSVELKMQLEDTEKILKVLGINPKEFDWELYEREKQHIPEMLKTPIEDIHYYMLAWILAPVAGVRAIYSIDENRVMELLLLVKLVLLHYGHDYMAMFMSCTLDTDVDFINPGVVIRNTLSKALSQEVAAMYKESINDRGNTVEQTIVKFSKSISDSWKPHGYMIPEYLSESGHLLPTNSIPELLIDYIKLVNEIYDKNKKEYLDDLKRYQ